MENRHEELASITGKRRYDLWLFAAILFLLLLTGYRLRVYYRSDPAPSPAHRVWNWDLQRPWRN